MWSEVGPIEDFRKESLAWGIIFPDHGNLVYCNGSKIKIQGTTNFTIFFVVTISSIDSIHVYPSRACNEFSEAWTRAIIAPVPVKDDSRLTAGGPRGANCR